MISEVAVKNEKDLKDLFLNCCNTLTLSNPEIKMECLECIYTAIGDIAENNISNINIQTIIDSNLYDILDNLYLMDDDEKVQAKAKEVLEKLKSFLSSDNVPEELDKTDEVIISKDIHPGSEYDGDHESLPEKESLPRLTNDNEYTSDQDYEADFKILHLL
uniref:Uncharacterized protein n=1 Tax=Panagrolaimus sp. ES5 TaxID=591445 RepID=A0AC34G874_9BILA